MTRLRTRHMAAVLSVAAIAAAGCGSSSSSKSSAQAPATPSTAATPSTPSTTGTTGLNLPPSVKAELLPAFQAVQAAGQKVKANPADPASYTQAATAFRNAATAVTKVKVPASSQAKVTKFADLLNQGAGDLDRLATDVKNKDEAALHTDLQKFQAVGQEINALKGQ